MLAVDPQYRLAFSHRTTPDQLFVKTLPETLNDDPYAPGTRGSLPDSER